MTDPIAGLNAALADHYIVDRELGRGGMAVVYLARDIKHERFVALKTLRPEIAQAVGRDRFLREIRLAARLQHPNILAVYDSGDAAGVLYYVMPYVEGESLRDRLEREPQLPIDDALQITREVSEALTYAHSHDVVHRDIKPENIMLSGGHAIVADFGIARAISAAGGDKLTETGLAIGTPAYMSPEQSAGTGKVDRRSDIYSLGCVLYETLAGQPPFTGPTAQAIMARHSLDSVPRLKIVREAIPDDLEAVIDRALEKVPADRYQTAAQFAEALAAASTGTVSRVKPRESTSGGFPWRMRKPVVVVVVPLVALLAVGAWLVWGGGRRAGGAVSDGGGLDRRRVAVLYFQDLSRDSSLGYLADGLTEAVIEALAPVRTLDVISRNGVARFRASSLPRDSIARALEAGTLVEGSVEPVQDRIRITVRLVDGGSGADIRRQGFELARGDLLAARDSLAQEAARFLRVRLGEEVRLRVRLLETRSLEAWTLYQQAERARKEAQGLVRTNLEQALRAFDRADSILAAAEQADPQWSEPLVLRAQVAQRAAQALAANPGDMPAWVDRGVAHARRALALTPGHPGALEALGTLRYYRYLYRLAPPPMRDAELRAAQDDLQTVVRIGPTATAYAQLSHLLYQTRDVPAALIAAQQAYQADAYLEAADHVLWRLFAGSFDTELFRQAREACDEGARRFPEDYRFINCQLWLMTTDARERNISEAWRLVAMAESLAPSARRNFERYRGMIYVGAVLGRLGLKDSARAVLVRSREGWRGEFGSELIGLEAMAHVQIGDPDEAIALLKQYLAGDLSHLFREGGDVHWWWRPLRDHPEFRAISGRRQ